MVLNSLSRHRLPLPLLLVFSFLLLTHSSLLPAGMFCRPEVLEAYQSWTTLSCHDKEDGYLERQTFACFD
jgi:hypothetical protein